MLIVAGIFVAGLVYYYGFLAPRGHRYWRITTDPAAELERLAAVERGS